ncbi:SLAM family member 7 isoform X2 [Oreochromis niloticus]|uniref:SLAM family member 7 isoform X2 n=1 Tax=Oreochromis niloticus TaxID=8128 RepID=UPI000905D12F|nr:SLAM family member 7 isoform X2 [Oreochromis niloticus]
MMRFSASEEVKKNLTGTVGGNITLPAPVLEEGFLSYGGKIIVMVNNGEFKVYKNRLQWDRNSGLFTLTELQRNDSGIYTVDSKTGNDFTSSYKLTVYDSVPTPAVKKVSVSSESCSLLCLVDRETKLLWFKDEQRLNQSSSALSLPLTVHKQDFSSSYRCVAANPAEEKTLPVHVNTTCGDTNNDTNSSTEPRNYNILIIIFCVLSATLIIIIIILIMRRKHPVQDKFNLLQAAGRAPVDEVVLYTDTGDSRQGGILAAVSGTSDGSSLTAVSYKLVLVT